jgi:hypothetical protein
MKTNEMKTFVNTLRELNEGYVDFLQTVKGTVKEITITRQLWRDGNKSRLVKLGLALIAFPEPTPISETIGSFLVAAGLIQEGLKHRSLYVEDVPKTFQTLLKELQTSRDSL